MLKIGVYACQIFPECEEHNICMSLYIWGCLSHVYVSSSLFPGLLPYLVARRIQTCPSLGSPHTVTPLQRQSLPSAPHTPTSTHIWTTSAPCTAARPSPWSQLPEGWALQMVSLRQFFHRSLPPTAPWHPCLSPVALCEADPIYGKVFHTTGHVAKFKFNSCLQHCFCGWQCLYFHVSIAVYRGIK